MTELDELPDAPTLEQIHQLERFSSHAAAGRQLRTSHYFADGVYGRALLIPAGTA
jgi:hypothetical protein